jgi:cytochrome c biogenesis protein CcmG/thiol:disulfide interchange protein DsbE
MKNENSFAENKPMRKYLSLSCLLLIGFNVNAQMLAVGEKAPPIQIETVLNKNVPADFLKGKYVVLDFWETWCIPCIGSFSYVDSIAKTIKSDNMVFAIISDESTQKITRFFETHKQFRNNLYKIIDKKDSTKDGSPFPGMTFKGFKVRSVPKTFIIDPNGIVKWQGYPTSLNTELINNIINGQSLSIAKEGVSVQNKVLSLDSALINGYQIKSEVISREMGNSMIDYEDKTTYIYFGGIKMNTILAKLFTIKEKQIEFRSIGGSTIPILTLQIKKQTASRLDSIAMATLTGLSKFYDFTFQFEKKKQEAYELILQDPQKLIRNAIPFDDKNNRSGSAVSQKSIFAMNYSFTSIGDLLMMVYKDLILNINEKNGNEVKGKKFDFNIPIGNFHETRLFLLKKYGIELKRKTVEAPMLVIHFNGSRNT